MVSFTSTWLLQSVIVFMLFGISNCIIGRVKDRIYMNLYTSNACFRILNGTRQFGCHSGREGSIGILHYIENDTDFDYILNDPGKHGPFIAAMGVNYFRNESVVKKLHNSRSVNGMLVIQDEDEKEGNVDFRFSEDSTCPNDASGLYAKDQSYGGCKKQTWNDNSPGYRYMDFKMPVFLVTNKTEIVLLLDKCFKKYNKPDGTKPPRYPLCAVSLVMFNEAAGNAVRCIRRGNLISGLDSAKPVCDPLGDLNVHGTIPETNKSRVLAPQSVLLLASRMDSFSMFADNDPGAESSLSNVIVMLAMAEALGRNKEFISNSSSVTGRHLMQIFFHGESFDYIGSSRVVWDMANKKFPSSRFDDLQDQPALVTLDNLALILEVNQVALPGTGGYFIHVDPNSLVRPATSATVTKVSDLLVNYSNGEINPKVLTSMPLPPSSVQRFLLAANNTLPALVITDHEGVFSNKYYNSFMDKPIYQIDKKQIAPRIEKLANTILQYSLEWLSNGKLPPNWKVNDTMIRRLMDCFWSWPDWKCSTFEKIAIASGFPGSYKKSTFQRTYIGPYYSNPLTKWSPVRNYVNYLMAYFYGEKYSKNAIQKCDSSLLSNRTGSIYTYITMPDLFDTSNDTYCVVSTVNLSLAKSPAFDIDGYDLNSAIYSTWVESRWQETSVKIFLVPDPNWEGAVLAVGILVLLLSLVVVYLITSGSEVLFTSTEITAL